MAGTTLTPAELETKVCHDEFKLVGDYVPGRGFVDSDLQGLLKYYCDQDKVDLSKMDSSGVPAWLVAWQSRVPALEEWNSAAQGRAGVAEAYLRWFFRQKCKKAEVDYAESCDEFFAELFKSSTNKQADDFAKGATWEPQEPPANSGSGKVAKPPAPHPLPAKPEANPKPSNSRGGKSGSGDGNSGAASSASASGSSSASPSGDSSQSPLYNPPPPRNAIERRMRAAWHSARIEIDRGYKKYGDGKWTTGPNSGPLIDPYQKAAYSTPGPGAPWCGIFQAWNYRQAGIKADEKIDKKFQVTGNAGKRVFVFWSTIRLKYYWEAAKSPTLKFPYEQYGKWKKDDCIKFLKDKLNPFAPVPGDILLVDTYKPLAHVAMVGGYDPNTFQLITYEGNCGDKAAAHIWDLSAPTKHGFFRLNHIGRMLESDFGDLATVQPEGPSPDPKVNGATSATGRYGG